ncbi:unnamed protein product [Rotaria magnacalcarata]
MEAVAKAILAAREEILIACWLISPEVKLVRPYDDDDGSMRLVSLLNKRANSSIFENFILIDSTLLDRTLQDKNLLLNPLKCELAVQQINYLGHTITKNSIQPMNDKIEAILRIQEPRTLAQANRFLGSLGRYRKFLPKFAEIAAPIHSVTNLTRANQRKFKWQPVQSKAFHQLKELLTTEPLFLHFPVDDLPLILTTDASDIGIGGVLQQESDDLFDIEYGLVSKNHSTLSSVTSNNDTNNLTSD